MAVIVVVTPSPGGPDVRDRAEVLPDWSEFDLMDHAAAMYRVAAAVVRDLVLAEDVVQESMVKAWLHRDGFREEASIRTWLLRITHNTAVSMVRARREIAADAVDQPTAAEEGVEQAVVGRAFREAFEEALFKLDGLSRAVLVLRELEEMPYEEIGRVLEVPLSTVKTRLYRSRHRLAVLLDDWGPGS